MEDAEIVELFWARNEDAIKETDAVYGRRLNALAKNILQSREDAEESVNDTYLTAWNAMPPRRPSILATFLGKITRRLAIDRWRYRNACKRGGGEVTLALDELERTSVKLLHSKTGAALAEHVFCEPKEECEAIFSHTTGKAGMTKLDKILYLADYMEPTRDFDGVEELRRLVWEDLDQAMILGLEMSIEELKERGVPVHRNTLAALEDLQRRQQ